MGIVLFDLSAIPANAQIVSAFLTLYSFEVNNGGGTINVGRLLNPDASPAWSDLGSSNYQFNQKATWRYKDEGTPRKWSVAGANANISDVLGSVESSWVPTIFFVGTHDFDVKSMVSAWVAGTLVNAGLYVASGATDPNCRMYGNYEADVTKRPKLTIVYNPDPSSSSSSRSSSSSCSSSSCRSSSSSCSSSSSRSSSSSSSSKGSSSSCSSSCSSRSSSSSCRSSSSSSSSLYSAFAGNVFTSGDLSDLPAADVDLPYVFSTTDYSAVSNQDGTYLATDGQAEFLVVQFKNTVSPGQPFTITWRGKSNLACSVSTIFLQVLNRTTNTWETINQDSTTAANTDLTLAATVSSGLSDYLDVNNKITARIYQELIYD